MTLTSEGEPCDERLLWVGLREVRLVHQDPATLAPAFRFLVNGVPVYLQGAVWAPAEGLAHSPAPERSARLLDLAHRAHLNALRVWGEGGVPDEAFYDACDRRGILVWQDLPFGAGPYPEDDPAFLRNARADAESLVRRLRNHPSVLLWAGGHESRPGGGRLFHQALPEICTRLDPTRPYHPASPHGGPEPNWPLAGDWHDDTATTFSPGTSVPTFTSQVGRVSAPPVGSLRRFFGEEGLWPAGHDPAITAPGRAAWPPEWGVRAADGAWERVGPVERYLDARTPESLVRVLGQAHGEYLRERIERARRGVPDGAPAGVRRSGGSLIWRLDDPWPAVSESLVDYDLEPKIAYYHARRACAPVLLAFERTEDDLHLWVVNDSAAPVRGTLRVRRVRFDGAVCAETTRQVEVAPAGRGGWWGPSRRGRSPYGTSSSSPPSATPAAHGSTGRPTSSPGSATSPSRPPRSAPGSTGARSRSRPTCTPEGWPWRSPAPRRRSLRTTISTWRRARRGGSPSSSPSPGIRSPSAP